MGGRGADCPPGHQKSGRRAKIGKGKKGERKEKRGKGREKRKGKEEERERKGKGKGKGEEEGTVSKVKMCIDIVSFSRNYSFD